MSRQRVRGLAGDEFIAHQRKVILVGGTETGNARLFIAIARACIRAGACGRFFNVVDLVNRLDGEVVLTLKTGPLRWG